MESIEVADQLPAPFLRNSNMGLTARQRRIFDKKQSVNKSMKEAVASASKGATGFKKKKKEKWTTKLKRSVKELIGGKSTYMPKKKLLGKRTTRTKAIESGLKKSGLTKQEIARFGGK